MNDEDWIIGRAVIDIFQSDPEQEISKELLIKFLTDKYVAIYENSAEVDEILLYESALKWVTDCLN
ncbi:hypothetical protein [Pseudescherichia vulneris]|uniref:hypothetical protein n=1 Tax=Pseudescherichia vulneris TaxID=566 RepID=UPI0030C9C818